MLFVMTFNIFTVYLIMLGVKKEYISVIDLPGVNIFQQNTFQ